LTPGEHYRWAYYSASNIGILLALDGQIEGGNSEGAYQAFTRAGDDARADSPAWCGHRVSARQAYLWAAGFYHSATYFVDATADPSCFRPTWEAHLACWEQAIARFDPSVERVQIPYEHTPLRGYLFRVDTSTRQRPLLILNNGSDGTALDMWTLGGAGGVARGYHCLAFDGLGQGYALWKQGRCFRPDWERAVVPVVDYALRRPEVDPHRSDCTAYILRFDQAKALRGCAPAVRPS
jgi:hypothetical protein